jgi:TolB protein
MTGPGDDDASDLVVFVSEAGPSRAIFAMRPDGSERHQLIAHGLDPDWSLDRQQIAFVSRESGGGVWVVDAEGKNPIQITDQPSFRYQDPDWSPDGSRIAFAIEGDIYVVNADGTGRNQLLSDCEDDSDATPKWSPDGEWIAFRSTRGDSCRRRAWRDLWVMRADGSNPRQVTFLQDENGVADAAWSPDGLRIAYTDFSDFGIYVIDVDGSNVTRLTQSSEFCWGPCWSPDGSKIMYVRVGDQHESTDLWMMNADGSNAVNVTLTPSVPESSPDW